MKQPKFNDYDKAEYERRKDAEEKRGHLKLVSKVLAGGEDEASTAAARLALDYADVTDGVSLTATDLKLPLHLRAFLDAVVGATAGSPDFEFVTDKDLAKRMGRSTKTVQNYRNEWRAWKDHAVLCEVKDNWRHPDTRESFPHAYRCHATVLGVETAMDARLSPEYAKDRSMALRKAAHTVADCAPAFPPRKAKKRPPQDDKKILAQKLKSATAALERASALKQIVVNPNYDEVFELLEQVNVAFIATSEAYGFKPSNFHANTLREQVEVAEPEISDVSAPESRMEAPFEGGKQGVVEKFSSTLFSGGQSSPQEKSTTYEKPPLDVVVVKATDSRTVERLCRDCLRVVTFESVSGLKCPCGGQICSCSTCRETIRRLRNGTLETSRLGLHKELSPFSHWSESSGAVFGVVAPVGMSAEEAERVWGNLTARLTREEKGVQL
jgi:hypothetical protein